MKIKGGHYEIVASGSPELLLRKVGRFRSVPATSQHLGGGPGIGENAREPQAGLRLALTPGDSGYELTSQAFRHKPHSTSQTPETGPKDMLCVLPTSTPGCPFST